MSEQHKVGKGQSSTLVLLAKVLAMHAQDKTLNILQKVTFMGLSN